MVLVNAVDLIQNKLGLIRWPFQFFRPNLQRCHTIFCGFQALSSDVENNLGSFAYILRYTVLYTVCSIYVIYWKFDLFYWHDYGIVYVTCNVTSSLLHANWMSLIYSFSIYYVKPLTVFPRTVFVALVGFHYRGSSVYRYYKTSKKKLNERADSKIKPLNKFACF